MRNLSVIILLVGFISLFAVSTYLNSLYAQTRPTSPNAASGRVYEHPIRGGDPVYLTRTESLAWASSYYGGALLVILGGVLFEREKRKHANGAA